MNDRRTRVALLLLSVAMVLAVADRCVAEDTPAIALPTIHLLDLDGHVHSVGGNQVRAQAVVFVGVECPISSAYVPQLNGMSKSALAAGVDLMLVISDPTVTRAAANEYRKSYQIQPPVLFDASGELAKALKPACTPEAFVLDRAGVVQYRGRIDDSYAALNKKKEHVDHHDLADAIAAVASGKPVATPHTTAIGCAFEAWNARGVTARITYTRDVAPILASNCVSCHRPGEVAPFSLTSYEDAAKRAKQLATVTEARLMPPWKAEPDFGHFLGERRLTDAEIETLQQWADAGAPRGDAADLPPNGDAGAEWPLGKPDLVLTMPKAFDVPAGGRDIYRAFVLPSGITEDKYVSAIDFRAGATTVVHHCLLYLDTTGAAAQKALASNDGEPGYKSFGGPGFRATGGLGGWAPGAYPIPLPDGTGRLMRSGSDVVLQIHYHPDGKAHQDISRVAIYFAKKPVENIVRSFPIGDRKIDIAPGNAHYVKDISRITPVDATVWGVTPHMHLLGREMKVTATTPDGKLIPLLWIKDWDFRWQDQYKYAEPIHLPKGTRIDVHAVYDNSAGNPTNPNSPPKRVTYGEETTDEMCFCFFEVTASRRGPIANLLSRLAPTTDPATAK